MKTPALDPLPDAVVLDASFVLRFVLNTGAPRPAGEGLAALRDCELIVPPQWNVEVANALVQAERRNPAAAERIDAALSAILALAPAVDAHSIDVPRSLECARAFGLSTYDACYLELAMRRKAALATFDADLIAAAPRAGVRLHPKPVSA